MGSGSSGGLGYEKEIAETIGSFENAFTSKFAPDVPLIVRIAAAHTTVIPMLALPVLMLHIVLIRLLGMSGTKFLRNGKISSAVEKYVQFSSHVKQMLAYGVGILIIIIMLALTIPATLQMRGVEGIEDTKPPWYLLWIYPLERLFGLSVIPYVSGIIIVILAAVPLVDRKEITEPLKRKGMVSL